MNKTRELLTALLGLAFTTAWVSCTIAYARPPELRVVSFNWKRWVDGEGAAVVHSGKRVFWPGWDRKRIAAAVKAEGADARWWSPRNSSERYWVVLSDGSEVELPLREWTRLERGSVVPR